MYLRICNQGVCDYKMLTLLGASGSRGNSDKIGQFGSGAILGNLCLLRAGISPIIYSGNLKMEFRANPIMVDGKQFKQVEVYLSGKLPDGSNVRRKEPQSYTLEYGIYDWKQLFMGIREWISNAIDGSIENTSNYKDVVIDVVSEPRARAGYTQVFIPYTEDVKSFVNIIPEWFLHFNKKSSPKSTIIEKDKPGPARIYYKGVLIRTIGENSLFDYNVNNLTLDESRNSDEWSCRSSVAEVLCRKENKAYLKRVLRETSKNKELFEASISQYTWSYYKEAIADAYSEEFGNNAVLVSEVTANHVSKKGFIPIMLNDGFASVLRTVERLRTDSKVLDHAECSGFEVFAATDFQLKEVDKVWGVFEYLNLTNGKSKPETKSIFKAMDGEKKLKGMYQNGVVYLDSHISGIELTQTVTEELMHHATNAGDLSRDLQEHCFLMISKLIT